MSALDRAMEDYADAKVMAMLQKLVQLFDMRLQEMEDRDPATIQQRQGTPMPPDLIEAWTDVKWAMSHPYLPEEAKIEWRDFTLAKVIPRLGMYMRGMVPVEDMMRKYLEDWETEVVDIKIDPTLRAAVLDAAKREALEGPREVPPALPLPSPTESEYEGEEE